MLDSESVSAILAHGKHLGLSVSATTGSRLVSVPKKNCKKTKAQPGQRRGKSMRARNKIKFRWAALSDLCVIRMTSSDERWGHRKKVTICPSGPNGTNLGFVAVTRSDCPASLRICITEKTTFIHCQRNLIKRHFHALGCAPGAWRTVAKLVFQVGPAPKPRPRRGRRE